MKRVTLFVTMLIFTIIDADVTDDDLPLNSEPRLSVYHKNNRYFYFPGDGNGKIYLVDSEAVAPRILGGSLGSTYWLYTRKNMNDSQELKVNDKESVSKSNFNITKNSVFIVHGWKGSCNNTVSTILTAAFLEDQDVNVIVVDYSKDASLMYILAQAAAEDIGKDLGNLISWMHTLGMSYEKTHLVGFSLGGHIVGIAGRSANGTVKRITALDPAGPFWYDNELRINNTDADYVEIIHTNTLFFGYDGNLGDADFYPNGGIFMPECDLNVCSHSVSYYYMAQSVKYNNLIANECKNYNEISVDICNGEQYPMGNSDLTKNRTGMFRLDTVQDERLIPKLR